MKKLCFLVAFLHAAMSFAPSAHARSPVPIVDHIDVAVVTGSGKPVTKDQLRAAITSAANSLKWNVVKNPDSDQLSATLNVNNKHTVTVGIPYSAEKYSIKYENSVNMKYQPAESAPSYDAAQPASNVPVIHPFYNRWVDELLKAVRVELNRL